MKTLHLSSVFTCSHVHGVLNSKITLWQLSNMFQNYVILLVLLLWSVLSNGQILNPLDYGLLEAKSNIERFRVLEACHKDAVKIGANVSYQGIQEITLDIPNGASSIPLAKSTDFCGVRLHVVNQYRDITLFEYVHSKKQISLPGSVLFKGAKLDHQELRGGMKMLVIQDDSLWVYRRRNKPYGATRRDILLVKDGMVQNNPVVGYNNTASRPSIYLCTTDEKGLNFGNIVLERDSLSTKKTFLARFVNVYNLKLHDITIHTNNSINLYADRAISVENASVLTLDNIRIEGTYSQVGQYGYGIELNNIFDLRINRMYARCEWGVFGCNNINKAVLTDCDINRFDIHCYGRDVKSIRCKYSGLYNQFSSIYGKVEFESCSFSRFYPVLMESSYNAYTPFDISFRKCIFYMTDKTNFLVTLLGLEERHNSRPELFRKSLPNITIQNCQLNYVEFPQNRPFKWFIVNTGNVRYKESLDYISNIKIDGLLVNQPCDFDIFSSEIRTTTTLNVTIRNMCVIQNGKRKKYTMPFATVDANAKVICNGKEVRRKMLADMAFGNQLYIVLACGLLMTPCGYILVHKYADHNKYSNITCRL